MNLYTEELQTACAANDWGRAVAIVAETTARVHELIQARDARDRELAELRAAVHAFNDVAMCRPWGLFDTLDRLAWAADYLVCVWGSDHHGHEETSAARDSAREMRPELERAWRKLLGLAKRSENA